MLQVSGLILWTAVGSLAWGLPGQRSQSKPAPKGAAPKASTKKTVTPKPTAKSGARVSNRKKSRTPSWRSRQQKPARERYREIEQALASRGYLAGQATGDWSADSVEALKQFQTDQKLKASGKIDSLSLIALGLGPPRSTPKPPGPPQ